MILICIVKLWQLKHTHFVQICDKSQIKMVILVLCIIFLVLGFIRYIFHVQHMESYLKSMKSISPRIPRIGNIILFMGKSMQNIYEEVVEVILRNKTPMKAQLGPAYFIIVDNPEDMKTILTSPHCYDKPYPYDFFHLTSGILTQRCKILDIFLLMISMFIF